MPYLLEEAEGQPPALRAASSRLSWRLLPGRSPVGRQNCPVRLRPSLPRAREVSRCVVADACSGEGSRKWAPSGAARCARRSQAPMTAGTRGAGNARRCLRQVIIDDKRVSRRHAVLVVEKLPPTSMADTACLPALCLEDESRFGWVVSPCTPTLVPLPRCMVEASSTWMMFQPPGSYR
jgi:hypothetical protein